MEEASSVLLPVSAHPSVPALPARGYRGLVMTQFPPLA